jgi:hypothetical protein
MKRAAIVLGILVTAAGCGCWRPYYGQTYAPPAYQQAPVYQQPAMIQQAPVVQQGCAPVVCQPNPCCY